MTYGELRGRHARPATDGDDTGSWSAGTDTGSWSARPDTATTGNGHHDGYGGVGYQPGTRLPTRDPESTGWPEPDEAPSPPALASGRTNGVGWPQTPDRTPVDAGRRGRGPTPPPPLRRGATWRTYALVGAFLLAVTVGVGGAMWKTGWLKAPHVPTSGPQPPTNPSQPAGEAVPTGTPSPTGPAVVDPGAGTFAAADSEGAVLGTAGILRRFHVQVENGINEDPNAFAAVIDKVLGDPRSWIASGQFRLQRVPPAAAAEFTIFLASPTTSESMCAKGGLHTDKFTSCRLVGQVIINDARWQTAIPDYGAPLDVYRTYAVNHEVGHQLGHGHEACLGPGQLAPVMQQQTYGLKGCVANPWPFVNGQRYAGPPIP